MGSSIQFHQYAVIRENVYAGKPCRLDVRAHADRKAPGGEAAAAVGDKELDGKVCANRLVCVRDGEIDASSTGEFHHVSRAIAPTDEEAWSVAKIDVPDGASKCSFLADENGCGEGDVGEFGRVVETFAADAAVLRDGEQIMSWTGNPERVGRRAHPCIESSFDW